MTALPYAEVRTVTIALVHDGRGFDSAAETSRARASEDRLLRPEGDAGASRSARDTLSVNLGSGRSSRVLVAHDAPEDS
jgi:hypothetical protein